MKELIEKYVEEHLPEMIEDLKAMCRIDSVRTDPVEGAPFGPGPLMALNAASDLSEKYGLKITDYDNFARTADLCPEGEAALDILAHVDVVPAGDGWTETKPFEPVLKDGRVYGRGCADDKGGFIASLYAMRAVKELGIPISRRCRLIIGCAEETGMEDVTHYFETEKPAPMTVSPDAFYPVINVEKGRVAVSYDAIFPASNSKRRLVSLEGGIAINQVPASATAVVMGVMAADIAEEEHITRDTETHTFTVTYEYEDVAMMTMDTGVSFVFEEIEGGLRIYANGLAAHASTPEKGHNAVIALAELIHRLELDPSGGLKILDDYICFYSSGEYYGFLSNMYAEDEVSGKTTCAPDILRITETSFHAEVDYRTACCADEMDIEEALSAVADDLGALLTITDKVSSHMVPKDSEFVRTLLECYEEATGEKGECISMGGSTYVHEIEGGVAFGHLPADEDVHEHGPNEYMPVEYLKKTAVIYALSIAKLCK